jgi:hypothetical protein
MNKLLVTFQRRCRRFENSAIWRRCRKSLENKLLLLLEVFNIHTNAFHIIHCTRGIAFSWKYGMDIMAESGTSPFCYSLQEKIKYVFKQYFLLKRSSTLLMVGVYDTDRPRGWLWAVLSIEFFNNPKMLFLQHKEKWLNRTKMLQNRMLQREYGWVIF